MLEASEVDTLFLDRDGVINRRLPGAYVSSWKDFEFLPGVVDTLRELSNYFKYFILVTNQQGIGKGVMEVGELEALHRSMLRAIGEGGGRLDAIYYCPHLKTAGCDCRKPRPGMGRRALRDFPDIDFQRSIMVGDSVSDMEFGSRLGMTNVLIETKLEEMELWPKVQAACRCGSLAAFAEKILR